MTQRSLVTLPSRRSLAVSDIGPFATLQRQIDRLFDDLTSGVATLPTASLVPNIDVTETDEEIEVTVELPGLERNDVEISVDNDVLTISGEKKVETKEEEKDKKVRLTERAYGVFYRTIYLPAGIDPASIQATMANGVLKLTIPKPAKSEAKKIEIKEAA